MNEEELLKLAHDASQKAYCPYSKFQVGACVLYESGKYYTGCNVENSSYGLSLCAERNAISNAISNGENSKLRAVAIYSPSTTKCFPCGACRQWFAEFERTENFKVVLENEDKTPISYTMDELLPNNFNLIR